jgi:hypothetical protein
MATITRQEIVEAFERLGQLAKARGMKIELALVGGALMVLAFGARNSTRDIDAVIIAPSDARTVRELAQIVADERGWPVDWLNDGAKGFLIGLSHGPVVLTAPGIEVRRPAIAQLLAMKLSAWRDDVDIADARRLLQEASGVREEVWQAVEPFLAPGSELKARYAFDDLWEALHGDT